MPVSAPKTQYVTALPIGYDGLEVHFGADPTNGVIWHLRYRSAASGSYKWEYVGGSEMSGETTADLGNFTSTSYATTGSLAALPTVTNPLAGDYDVRIFAQSLANDTTDAYTRLALKIGAAAASDNDALIHRITSGHYHTLEGVLRKTGLSASTVLGLAIKVASGQAFNVGAGSRFTVGILPVRVG